MLKATVSGNYNDNIPLANVTIAGYSGQVKSVSVNGATASKAQVRSGSDNVLYITGLQDATSKGAYNSDLTIQLQGAGSSGSASVSSTLSSKVSSSQKKWATSHGAATYHGSPSAWTAWGAKSTGGW